MARRDLTRWLQLLLRGALFALAYLVLRRVSERLFVLYPAQISSFWPPSGFALASLLRARRSLWPALGLALLLVSTGDLLITGLPVPVAVGWGVAATLEPLLGATLMQRLLRAPRALTHVRDVLGFVALGAVAGPLVGGTLAAAVSDRFLGGSFLTDWFRWGMSGGLGVLLVGPLFLTFDTAHLPRLRIQRPQRSFLLRLLEALVLLGAVAAVNWRLVSVPISPPTALLLATYATFPFFLWAALRFGVPGVAGTVALVASLVGWHIAHGQSPFPPLAATSHEQLVALQAFLAVGSICGLVLAAALEERHHALRNQALLADASARLGESLEEKDSLARVAERVVPELAEGCVFLLDRGEEAPAPVAAAGVDPALGARLAEHLARRTRGGSERQERELLGDCHLLTVPLRSRERVLGWLVLLSRSRRFDPEDLALAEELARRCALAVERAQLHREQQEAVRARDDFLTVVSHELKTPLTPLSLQLETMKRRLHAGQPVDVAAVDKLRRSLERLVALINDLLDSSRVAAGRLPLQLAPTPLNPLVRDVAAGFASASAEHPLEVVVPEEEVWVSGDRSRLEQVLANLLDNAIKYSPLGGPVRVSLQVEGEEARLSVSDRGVGIPADQQKQLFARFFRARNISMRSFGGLGLGLYISRDIVERHGGRLWVESTPGAGSTFHVALPLLRAADRPVPAHGAEEPSPPPPG